MTLIFLNRYFYPDHSATSQVLTDIAFGLAAKGYRVRVVTSRQRYSDRSAQLPSRESVRGVEVHRVWTTRFGRSGLPGRAVDYLAFHLASAWTLWRLARAGDVIIAKTDPPMLSVSAAPVARLRGAKLVNWLQDIFPEVAQALGLGRGWLAEQTYGLMRRLRDRSLKRATMNVVLSERMAQRLAGLGVPRERTCVIANFSDGALVAPRPTSGNALRRAWGLGDRFVIGYSGNLGRAHEYETMLDAMARLEAQGGRHKVTWLFTGGGALYRQLKREVEQRGLTSVRFEAYQPRARLAESLSVADVHIVSLRPELEGLIVPSKFYGIAGVGRPTIFIGDPQGEIAGILARLDCGRTVPMGDGEALARTIVEMAANRGGCDAMGERARRAFEQEFDTRIAVDRWDKLLLRIGAPTGSRHADAAREVEPEEPARKAL
jgi:glycosyltransferase involved in cell wall biosynthesis